MKITDFVVASLLLLGPLQSFLAAASLKPETKAAWDAYLRTANQAMQARLRPGAHFLWTDEEPGRAGNIRTQGPYILPMGEHMPKKVPGGLIHHWQGAGFVPHARIEDILRIMRSYQQYKDIYSPGVIDSKETSSDGMTDLFTMRLANRSVVAKTALDADCKATYYRVDDHRWYSVSNSTRIIELDKFDTPEQHALAEDQGSGLIWRLSSITRLEERDGGVYAELEAIVLSRDIPAALRLFVTPIVRRVSRDSLATSLHQTKAAIDADMGKRAEVRPPR